MTIDVTMIFKGVVILIGALLTRYVIPWLTQNVDAKKRAAIADLVETGVYAADRWLKSASGAEKKEYVIAFLAENGYRVDTEDVHSELNVMIEAAVERLRIEQAYYLPAGDGNEQAYYLPDGDGNVGCGQDGTERAEEA